MRHAAVTVVASLATALLASTRRSIGRAMLAGALVGVLVALGYLLGGCASSPPVTRSTVCAGVRSACAVAETYCSSAAR